MSLDPPPAGAQRGLHYPTFSLSTIGRETSVMVLRNDLLADFKQQGAGWKHKETADGKGHHFVSSLSSLLWIMMHMKAVEQDRRHEAKK